MKCDCVEKTLSQTYQKLGGVIAKKPHLFIIVPFVLSVILTIGNFYIEIEDDVRMLYIPLESFFMKSKNSIDRLFPMNSSDFDASRTTTLGNYASVIILAKDGGNILREKIFNDIIMVDRIIQNITVEKDGQKYNYKKQCSKRNGRCLSNKILDLSTNIKDIEEGKSFIFYPMNYNTTAYFDYSASLGGVKFNKSGLILSAKAVRLFYYLKDDNDFQKKISVKWEETFLKIMADLKLQHTVIFYISKASFDESPSMHLKIALPLGIITLIILFCYTILSFFTSDWVKSKPLLGLCCIFTIAMSVSSAFGLVTFCNERFNMSVIMIAFVMFGIGMDDAFVMMAAWKKSNAKARVVERMRSTYFDAGASITITSLTNMICFCIGMTTPFPGIKTLSVYAAVTVMFTYFYELTFFGGCMVLSGHREARNLHCITFRPVAVSKDIEIPKKDIQHSYYKIMQGLGIILTYPITKIVICFIFFLYLSISIWGTLIITEGLDFNSIFPANTHPIKFMDNTKRYYSQYPHRIQIAVLETLDYSNESVQNNIDNLIKNFEKSTYITPFFTESWLRSYLEFIETKKNESLYSGYNISVKQDFIDALYYVFLNNFQFMKFNKDIIFNKNRTEIIASRFYVQSFNVKTKYDEKNLFKKIKKIIFDEKYDIAIYNDWFPIKEQLFLVGIVTIKAICIAAVVMLGVFLLFFPDFKFAICVTLTVISIEVGIVGFLAFWNINLDIISMVNLVMCIGLSVDYTAHVCFAYGTSSFQTADEKFKDALNSVGVAVVQASITTILGVIALAFANAYTFEVFFKTTFLVSVLSSLHALFILPLLFYIFECKFIFKKESVQIERSIIDSDKIEKTMLDDNSIMKTVVEIDDTRKTDLENDDTNKIAGENNKFIVDNKTEKITVENDKINPDSYNIENDAMENIKVIVDSNYTENAAAEDEIDLKDIKDNENTAETITLNDIEYVTKL